MENEIGWNVFGFEATIRIVQTGSDNSYHDANKLAIEQLRSVLDPLAKRLAEIEGDVDLERNKMPSLKGWSDGTTLVIAHTKKRAAELVGDPKATFAKWYIACFGHWWYQFAKNESVWRINKTGANETWEKSLSLEEQRKADREDTTADE